MLVAIPLLVGGVGFGGYLYFKPNDPGVDIMGQIGGGSSSPSVKAAHFDLTGEPLFSFGSLYLDGRSSWCREQFDADRTAILEAPIVTVPETTTTLHREPFTAGKWVEKLSAEEAEVRTATESKGVEIRSRFVVRGVSPVDLLVFILASDFRTKLPKEPAASFQALFPGATTPDACLEEIPELDANYVMTREYWPAALLKQATDVWFLSKVGRDGDVHYYVYEFWKNCPRDGSFVNIQMSAGQYAISQRGEDCLVHVHTYYSGQAAPAWIPGVKAKVSDRSKAFYEGLAETIQDQAPEWEPTEDALRWRDGLKL